MLNPHDIVSEMKPKTKPPFQTQHPEYPFIWLAISSECSYQSY